MNQPRSANHRDHFFIAIGASAGGLEAIHEFFDHMPQSANLSFFVIQHLSLDHKSLLVELLAKHTSMQITEAGQNMIVEKGFIYVIPNNKLMTMEQGVLKLSERSTLKAPNTAINTFFSTLAREKKTEAIAVILSGTGTDGAAGAKDIKEAGGVVFVQDPITAKFDGMPNSAIAAGVADYILSPELIPEEIFNTLQEEPKGKKGKDGLDETKLSLVLELIQEHCAHDFTNYKAPTLLRRITRRMDKLEKNNFDEYFSYLKSSSEECKILGKDFLIGVTKFFRDRAVFDILEKEVLPQLVSNKEADEILKVWVTACSTGQEAYSLAILIDQYLESAGKTLDVKIFASDIDKEAIEHASKGAYSKITAEELDAEIFGKYFSVDGDQITIIPRIRKQIVFTSHNILKDPPFIKNDLVTCRNMLIYMNPILQAKVFNTLQFALNTKGYLVLGPSEVPHSIKSSLEEIDGRWKVYRKIANTPHYNGDRFSNYEIKNSLSNKNEIPLKESTIIRSLTDDFKEILSDEFGYAALYIDKAYEIKSAIGNYRKYLSLPDSIVNFNILKMVPADLSVALNSAIRKATATGKKLSLKNVRLRVDKSERYINLIVKPSTANTYTTIIFSEGGKAKQTTKNPVENHDVRTHEYTLQLEEDLRETRINLQAAVEGLETANEELQSSNEELLSSNEELQSSNEELQSLNEELHTLNTEHQLRIKELIDLNDDLNNYFSTTDIGQVFLDNDLRIRKFSPSAHNIINLMDADAGRPIDHISTNILNDGFLVEELKSVLRTGAPYEKEIQLRNGSTYIMKVLSYVRRDKVNDGLVITFVDVTTNKELDNIIKAVFNSSASSIMTVKALRDDKDAITDFVFTASNHAADDFLHMSSADYIGKPVKTVYPQLYNGGVFENFVEVMNAGDTFQYETAFTNNNKERVWYEVVLINMVNGLTINITNINDKKQAEEKLKTNYFELVSAKDNVRKLNTDLEKKVIKRTAELAESEERFRLVAGASSDAIWDWDLASNNIWWSDSFFILFGYQPEEVKDGSRFWFTHIHPDDLSKVKASMEGIMNGEARKWTASYRFRKANGDYAQILNKSHVLQDDHGTPYRLISSMMDVSAITEATTLLEKKNFELEKLIDEFKFVTDFMPQMVWATTAEGYHDFYNKGWYDYTGLSYEQSKGKGWNTVLHPADQNRAWLVWQHSMETGEPYEIEYRFRRHDGQYRWFLGRALPHRDENGNILKWFGTCTDIHDQIIENDLLEGKVSQRTAELLTTNKELSERNNELLQFTSVTSHDLKEPLRKIRMFGAMIRDRFSANLPPEGAGMLNKIVAASERMAKLIDDLLNFSMVDSENKFQVTHLGSLLDEVLDDLDVTIKEKNATIEASLHETIECIPGQFQRVFQNLISNSLKFARKTEAPHISIKGKLLPDQDERCQIYRIVYQDNGIGFEKHFAKKIFEIFQRLHSKDLYDGTGIGLAIVKKIVEKHNGEIIADGQENKGATFIITVPVKQPEKLTAEPLANTWMN